MNHPPHQNATETVFEPYTPKVRKRGTGCVYQVNDHLWEGSFYPRLPDGKRKKFNVYAKTRDECEKLLTEMIAEKKAEITELKQKAKQHKKGGIKKRSPLKICIGVNKEKI